MPEEHLMVIHQARKNLIDFEIATNKDYVPNWHHDVIAKELEHIEKHGDRDYKILIVTVPPRHGKSQMCSIDFPAWYLGKNPQKEIITASYSADLAQDFGGKTREKVNSEEYKLIFPGTILKEDEKARGRWKTNAGGSYIAVGVGGPITGRGADILLVDDPTKNREEAESEVYRQKTWDWFTSTAFTRLSPGGVVVIIMTRWHLDDLVGRVLNNKELSKRTKLIRFPAIAEKDELPYRQVGDPLWPDRFNLNVLSEIRSTIGPYDWQALYQGNPVTSADQEFKTQWIRKIDESNVQMMSCRRVLTVDTAMSKDARADDTGFCDNRINQENFWHLKAWGSKLSPEELVNTIFTLHVRNNYDVIGIEKTAYLDGLKPFLESEQRRRNIFLPIVELSHKQTAKELRIRSLIPRYASGSVFHINGECSKLEEQMMTFPVGMHDDVLDAVAYQEQISLQPLMNSMSVYIPEF